MKWVGEATTQPADVHDEMKVLLAGYNAQEKIDLDAILDFHVCFERIHPFQDGNGRVGRLLMFWQCLQNGVTPFIVTEDLRLYYYRGLQNWGQVNDFLRDTILTAQDMFEDVMRYFGIRP